MQGYIDVIDVYGDIVDVKTASKKPSGVRADYRVQVATYAMVAPGTASGRTIDSADDGMRLYLDGTKVHLSAVNAFSIAVF